MSLPLIKGGTVKCPIVAAHWHAGVLQLEIPAWRKGVEDRVYDKAVVFEAGEESPAVNEVEFLGEYPFIFGVINFEPAVWWNTVTINGGIRSEEIGAYKIG
jgi:hypothetical protein